MGAPWLLKLQFNGGVGGGGSSGEGWVWLLFNSYYPFNSRMKGYDELGLLALDRSELTSCFKALEFIKPTYLKQKDSVRNN